MPIFVNIHLYMGQVFEGRPFCGQTCFGLPALGATWYFSSSRCKTEVKDRGFCANNPKTFRRGISEMCKQAKNIAPKSIVTFSYAFCNISPALLWAQRAAVLLGALHPHKALLTARNPCKVLRSASRLRPPCACLLCAQSTRNHMWKRMKQMMQILLLRVVKGQLRYQLIRGISTKGVINDS